MNRLITSITALVLLSSCAGIRTGSVCIAEDEYWAGQQFLAWAEGYAYVGSDPLYAIAPVTVEQIKDEAERQFEMLGYRFTDDAAVADMELSFVVATSEELISISDAEDTYWWGVAGAPNKGYGGVGSVKEAFLAIDLVDAGSRRPLWRGWAEKTVAPTDREDPMPLIEEAVASILAELPAAARP
mgnify:CR=1 FL=1